MTPSNEPRDDLPIGLRGDALYHLATVAEWAGYESAGRIRPASLETEGFVHCSWGRQVPGTVAKHFADQRGVLALELDPDRLGAPVVEEDSYGSGQAFPHVYAAIPAAAVIATVVVVPA